MNLRLSATPGSEQTLPREASSRRVVHRRPFFRRQIVGLSQQQGREAAGGQLELGSRSCFGGTILRHPGERADSSPGGRLSSLPARRVGHGTRSFTGTS